MTLHWLVGCLYIDNMVVLFCSKMNGFGYYLVFNSNSPRKSMTKQKSQVPKAKTAYAERKRRQNETFSGFLKAYGLVKGPKIVLDDTDPEGKTLQSSAALIKAGVKAADIDVPNIGYEGGRFLETDGSRLVKKIGKKMGIKVHPTDFLSFLRKNPSKKANAANIDACASFKTVKLLVKEYVANHLVPGTKNLVSFTFEGHRTGHRPDDPLRHVDNAGQVDDFIRKELKKSCVPYFMNQHVTVLQNGPDTSNKMHLATLLIEPAEELHSQLIFPTKLAPVAQQVVYCHREDSTFVRGLVEVSKHTVKTIWCDGTVTKGNPWHQFNIHLDPPADAQILGEERSYTNVLVGRKVKKEFGAGIFVGTISYAQKIDDDIECSYRILFDDGDSADWSFEEVDSGLLPDKRKATCGAIPEAVAKRGRGRPPKNP